jgi:hypothetical protein
MQKSYMMKKENHYLTVSLKGDQSYVKIYDNCGELIRHSQTKGAPEIQQIVKPGKYLIDTDGTIQEITSKKLEIKMEDVPH